MSVSRYLGKRTISKPLVNKRKTGIKQETTNGNQISATSPEKPNQLFFSVFLGNYSGIALANINSHLRSNQ
ncbi:hypothetical protein C0W92_02290 [Photobacterium angustum]|uniref:Uncharacterized protein n=1 Tax=Photobacterium angustum TaxID=661 RepID=A0A855SI71_PHOAN|nr:hypothetical protein UB36_02920 [Photobacterium damselae subsp. damselae]KJG02311.1 hypothetical protein UB35_09370 [Photobacterium angustum]KJG31564.1 hypothetical protein UA69_07960 [Photobacterium angustum]KJG42628.1 hypothetical protein UA35_01140 [Photobacterium angustum]KJG47816.1 hypothetical protein UA31_02920 [Photobacterium angustum]